jgi:hypothetical protein
MRKDMKVKKSTDRTDADRIEAAARERVALGNAALAAAATPDAAPLSPLPWACYPYADRPGYYVRDASYTKVADDLTQADAELICMTANQYDELSAQWVTIDALRACMLRTLNLIGKWFASNPHQGFNALERAYTGLIFTLATYPGRDICGDNAGTTHGSSSGDSDKSTPDNCDASAPFALAFGAGAPADALADTLHITHNDHDTIISK